MNDRRGHIYTVELRIEAAGLDPMQVARDLALHPTHARLPGSPTNASGRQSRGVWGYSGSVLPDAPAREWDSLENGLLFLMRELDSKLPQLRAYLASCDVYWWCGHFQSSFDGGPRFSVFLLERLAAFGVPLAIDSYSSSE